MTRHQQPRGWCCARPSPRPTWRRCRRGTCRRRQADDPADPGRRAGGREPRTRAGAGRHRRLRGDARPSGAAVGPAAVRRRDHGHAAGHRSRPRGPQHRVPARLRGCRRRPAGAVGAGRRYRRDRRQTATSPARSPVLRRWRARSRPGSAPRRSSTGTTAAGCSKRSATRYAPTSTTSVPSWPHEARPASASGAAGEPA